MCQWEFDIIIIFNAIALALQPSKVRWTNLYLILKPLVFASTGKLYDNSHLPQNRCFLLPTGLPYFRASPSHLFYFLHPSYPPHLLHPSNYSHIVLSHSWNQGMKHHSVDVPGRLES